MAGDGSGASETTKEINFMNEEDLMVVAVYLVLMLSIALWALQRSTKLNLEDYFLKSHKLPWPLVSMGLYTIGVGGQHLIGLPGAGAKDGISISTYDFGTVYALVLLGWLFMPVYLAAQVQTMQEYMGKRLVRKRIVVLLAVASSLVRLITKMMTNVYGGALYMKYALSLPLYASEGIVISVAALLTIVGDIEPFIWTDFVQTILTILGTIIVMGVSYHHVGGESEIFTQFNIAEPNRSMYRLDEICNSVHPKSNQLFHDAGSEYLPWTGLVFGMPVVAVWQWCTDQVMVQRMLSSRNISHAKSAVLLVGFLKLCSLHLLVFPGMIARILFPDDVGCGGPIFCREVCGQPLGCTDYAYPILVTSLLPHGLQGFMAVGITSAMITSLRAVFSSTTTTFTVDIWPLWRQNSSNTEKILVGRIFLLLLTIGCVASVPLVEMLPGSELLLSTTAIVSCFAAPMVAVTVQAIFWERLTEPAAFWSLVVGLGVGTIRLISQFIFQKHNCGERPTEEGPDPLYMAMDDIIHGFHHLHFAALMFVVVNLLCFFISLCTSPVPKAQLYRLTYWRRHSKALRPPPPPRVGALPTHSEDAHPTGLAAIWPLRRTIPVQAAPQSQTPGPPTVGSSVTVQAAAVTLSPVEMQKEEMHAAVAALEESKFKRVNDVCAVLLIGVLFGFYGYYGIYTLLT